MIDAYARTNDPLYPTVTGRPGDVVVSQVDRTRLYDAAKPRFSIITDPNDPDYIAPPRNLRWEDVKIDPVTGVITTPISKRALPGTSADIPVRVTYKDGSTDKTIATVVVVAEQRQVYEPQYMLQTTTPGGVITSEITDESKIPERDLTKDPKQRYQVPSEVNGWKVGVDENGVVTATAPKGARPGDSVSVPVTVKYLDGSTDTVYAPFNVKENQKDISEPSYSVESTKPGTEVKRPVNRDGAPEGTTFSFGMDGDKPKTEDTVDGWAYKIDPKTGEIFVTPPADSKPGDKHVHNVMVTYPDGSTDETPVTTVVNLTQNFEVDPTYPPETTFPGDTVTAPLTIELPDGIDVAEKDPYKISPADGYTPTNDTNEFGNPTYTVRTANGDWIVGLDDKGNVVATAPTTAKPGDSIRVPVTVTYADGSTDRIYAPIKIQDAPTREVPYKVEYKYDDTIPAGEYKVETKGKPGSEKQNKDGSWEQTKAPVNEVVIVGTKPAKSAKEVTWTVPIPYPTEVRENPDLKPGETRVVQEGENGEKTYTVKFTAEGDKAEVAEEETTKEPVKRIVEYGPGLAPSELVTKTEKPIPFETEIVFDNTLEEGQQKVGQKGEHGIEVVTSTQKIVDGKPEGDPEVTTERTKEPVKQIIRVGTKTEGTHKTEYEVDVPFETEIQFDDTMEAGKQETVQEGKLGKDKVTTTLTIENSKVVDSKTETGRVTEPVKKIIKVGTKGKPASTEIEWTEKTPFEVEVRVNPDLQPGETKVVQEGKQGEVKHTVKVNAENGEISKEDTSEKISDPVKHIIEVGPAKNQTELTDKHTEKTPYDTLIEYDPNLEVGKVVEDQAGSFGEKEITKTWKLENGKPVGDPEVNENVVKDPQPRKLRVGTKCNCDKPTPTPTDDPTVDPTDDPTTDPTVDPTDDPTVDPTDDP
ncbi:G5 domain-containing protein, partial [Dermabacter sp. HMSC08H10]|uniref:G5 domain-containing protein n=1 Tax=Dermabacter sp. HMSC08H10 TaxID=1581144 RepID=UPI000B05F347